MPKKTSTKEYNDYRPIALISVPFKCLERILLKHLLPEIEDNLDPCQFSYRKNKSTEDATLLYNNLVVEHLENKNAYVRSVFIDFSSAFNTLKPDIVINKPWTLNVSPILCKFILDFLTNRERRVRINDILSTINQYRCTSRFCTLCYTAILLYCLQYTHTNYDHVSGIVM